MKELQDIDLKQVIEDLTGEHFNRDNKINSPFTNEKTPSFAVYFDSNANKQKFKDFSNSGKNGDALDFVMEYKNYSWNQAREYLGLEVEKTESENFEDKIKEFIDIQLQDFKKGYKLLGIFTFVDQNNNPIYSKAKFLKPDGKKETPYYSIQDGKVVNKRLYDEVPYNYYNLLQGIANSKTIVFLEGEKDVNTINNTLSKKDFVATSIKGFKDYDKIKGEFMKIAVIGDTGPAGEKYIWDIRKEFLKDASEFKIINLPNLKALGDNKDVTDWLESGYTKKDLLKAFSRSLNLKDKFEYQQDSKGIYFLKFSKDDEESKPKRVYVTDFTLLEAKKIIKIDAESEGIKLKVKSCVEGKTIEKIGSSRIFDDLKTFRNFLGIDLSFKGRLDDLINLKIWINKYFAIENEEIVEGTQFKRVGDKIALIGSTGTITDKGINYTLKAEETQIDILNANNIDSSNLKEVMKYLFEFLGKAKAYSIIGTLINNMAVIQAIESDVKLHHLLIVGESESGKSTILEKIIAPLLNYPITEKKSMSATDFAMTKDLSTGNYTSIYDEYKPSSLDQYKNKKISDKLRNSYDRTPQSRGDKSFKLKTFYLCRPLIIAGEESYPNSEKALITRSCIVYMAKNERTKESSQAVNWLGEHKELLNGLGRALVDTVINLSVEDYKSIRQAIRGQITDIYDRPLNTAINICTGIEILNILLEQHNLAKVENYILPVVANLKEEVLEGGEEAKSTIEQMLNLFSDMIADGRCPYYSHLIKSEKEGVYIRTSQMINEIFKFIKDYGSADVIPLKLKDFRKQATKAGYLLKANRKQIKAEQSSNPVWFDLYDREKLQSLNVNSIVEPDLMEEIVNRAEQNIIEGMFPGA